MQLLLFTSDTFVGQVGAVSFAKRLRTLAVFPQIIRSSEYGGTVPPSEPGNVRTLLVVALLWAIDKIVGRALRVASLAGLPSSIVSLLLSYAGLSVIEVTSGKRAAERVMRFFQPGVNFLGRWMMAVYTVSIVPLPSNLGVFRGMGDFIKFSALHAASWLFSIASTAVLVRSLTKAKTTTVDGGGGHRGRATKPLSNSGASQVKVHRAAVRSVWTTITAASYALVPWLGESPVRCSLPVRARWFSAAYLDKIIFDYFARCADFLHRDGCRRPGVVLDIAKLTFARGAATGVASATRTPSDHWYIWTTLFRCRSRG